MILHRVIDVGALFALAAVFAASAAAADTESAPPLRTVKIMDIVTRSPLKSTPVEITSEVVPPCLVAPCQVTERQRWQGATDAIGVLQYPATLEKPGAIVYAHVVGNSFAADVHGDGSKDEKGLTILRLKRPDAKQAHKK